MYGVMSTETRSQASWRLNSTQATAPPVELGASGLVEPSLGWYWYDQIVCQVAPISVEISARKPSVAAMSRRCQKLSSGWVAAPARLKRLALCRTLLLPCR